MEGGDKDRSLICKGSTSSQKYISEGDVDANTQNISTTKGLLGHFGGSRIVTEVAGDGKRGFAREEALFILVGPGRRGTPEPTRDR